MNLILCGMMGCGKTTIGRKIAQNMGKCWVDTDDVITEKYGKIADVFAEHGEEYFRDLETETIQALAQNDGLIISVGGGLVLRSKNTSLLKQNGKIVYLRAKIETLFSRLQKDSERPLLQSSENLWARLTNLMAVRAPIYEDVADYKVDVDGKTPDEIVAEIAASVED